MADRKVEPDCTHRTDPEARRRARETVCRAQERFSPDRGRWIRANAKTLKFKPYKKKLSFIYLKYKQI